MKTIVLRHHTRQVLDRGFVKLIDCMPRLVPIHSTLMCDSAIVQAARVSFNQGLKDDITDAKLINYLMRHKHTSPFEMVRFKFHVKAPLFVQRQWIRHRTANVNEISGRYSQLKGEFYVPDLINFQSNVNKQASAAHIISKTVKDQFDEYMQNSVNQYSKYNKLLELGVSKEMARIGLPLNLYTEFYWCIDLHNLFNFIRLREGNDAQPEIVQYAKTIKELIKHICPVSIKAFDNYVSNSISLSQKDCSQSLIEKRQNFFAVTSEQKELNNKIDKINNS